LANQEHLKICEDFGKTKNKDTIGLMRLYSGVNFVPKFRDKLFEDEDLKRRKIGETKPRKLCHAPRAWLLPHPHAPRAWCMHPKHPKCVGRKRLFLLFVGKFRVFNPNPVRNSHYKWQPSSFRISRSELEQFKRKAIIEL